MDGDDYLTLSFLHGGGDGGKVRYTPDLNVLSWGAQHAVYAVTAFDCVRLGNKRHVDD